MQPKISVCIANFNGEQLLWDCIDSVLNQQGGIDVEIIVHDDASTDRSVELLRARYPEVELLESTKNVGFCVANNRMAAQARGEYLLLLNNDAALHDDALTTLLEEAERLARSAILTLPQYDWTSGDLVDRGCLLDPFFNPVPNMDPSRADIAYVIGACLWMPRTLWNELHGFPEWMESIGEDLYLCGLARLAKVPVRAAARSGYRHRQGASFSGSRGATPGLQTSVRRRRLSERNKAFALFIVTPTILVWPLLAALLASLALEGAVLRLISRDRQITSEIYGNVFRSLFRERSSLRERRRIVQQTRSTTLMSFLSAFTLFPQKLRLLLRHGLPRVVR